ncbi:MarR family winged helix-turn-helix transcriptional regulator [Desulfovirgula thermocuniculi]|uniref:MarR family winged helix-turn-helix transcriptional regulator n=1 Tax=Desulfovirgula thermocuniculi TaxID=348842 RepID=UPI000401C12E|nr:MarR family transcriptional regulator [Desulfovirgula thermocuniculi]
MEGGNLGVLLERLDAVFQQLFRRLHARLVRSLPEGLTGSQFFALKLIFMRGRMTVSEMAEEHGVSLSAVTAMVDRLHRLGYVERQRDEADRRVVWLSLTPEGEELVRSCLASRRAVLEHYLSRLPAQDVVALVGIFEKLLAIFAQEETEEKKRG